MHTQICPLTQGSRRGMARLKPLPPLCHVHTEINFLNSEISHKFYPKKYIQSSKNPWIPQCQSHLPRSPALHPSRFQPRPPRPASCRKDTWRQDQHKMASQSWPWKLRKTTSCKASLCTWLGEGRVKLTTRSGVAGILEPGKKTTEDSCKTVEHSGNNLTIEGWIGWRGICLFFREGE